MNKNERKRAKLFDIRFLLYDFIKITGSVSWLIVTRPKWKYENEAAKKKLRGGAIVMMNHNGFLDPIYGMTALWYRRQHFVITDELIKSKFTEILFKIFRCIPIDRENFNFGSFKTITDKALDGRIVSIYPEGKINTDESSVAAFKAGIVMMALRSGCPIVPIYVKKTRLFFERATFCIGEPVNLREKYGVLPSMDTVAKISEELRDKLVLLKNQCEERESL